MLTHSQKNEIRKKVLHERCSTAYIDDIKTCSTLAELCKEMISKLPDMSGKILVLSDLGLLLEVLIKLNEEKLPSSNVSFIAHTEKVADIARKMIQNVQLVCYNELTDWLKDTKMGMIFDVVIGNPPYQGNTNKKIGTSGIKFYPKFIKLASNLLEKAGNLLFITPPGCFKTTIFEEKSEFLQKFTTEQSLVFLNQDCKNYFNVETPICWYHVINETYKGKTNIDNVILDLSKINFIPRCEAKDLELTCSIIKKISLKGINFNFIRKIIPNKPYLVSLKRLNHVGSGKFQIFKNKNDDLNYALTNQLEVDFISEILSHKLYKFINIVCRFDSVIYHNFFNGFKHPEFDNKQSLYDYFNITKNEINLIEKIVK